MGRWRRGGQERKREMCAAQLIKITILSQWSWDALLNFLVDDAVIFLCVCLHVIDTHSANRVPATDPEGLTWLVKSIDLK